MNHRLRGHKKWFRIRPRMRFRMKGNCKTLTTNRALCNGFHGEADTLSQCKLPLISSTILPLASPVRAEIFPNRQRVQYASLFASLVFLRSFSLPSPHSRANCASECAPPPKLGVKIIKWNSGKTHNWKLSWINYVENENCPISGGLRVQNYNF